MPNNVEIDLPIDLQFVTGSLWVPEDGGEGVFILMEADGQYAMVNLSNGQARNGLQPSHNLVTRGLRGVYKRANIKIW